jgi:2-polyprenyl-6-hydroxyphenyl methylase/3-demethylubiquinone-9 3-methyltransferase
MTGKAQICLWFENRDAADAARFYAETFPDSSVGGRMTAPGDYPSGTTGDELTVDFTVMGIPVMGLNGGPSGFKPSEFFSFSIITEDQEETDRYWNAIVGNGGEESMCGWCRDRWGISWQITPRALLEGMKDPDQASARRVMEAMLKMKKIDIATINAARKG